MSQASQNSPQNTVTPTTTNATSATGSVVLRQLSNYTPHLLALLLALGTFWLIKSMPDEGVGKPPPPADEPDYYMHNFSVYRYAPNGSLQTELKGSYGEHLPGPDTFHIQQAVTYSIDEQGNTTHGQAQRAISDNKGNNIELFDQVKITHQRHTAQGQAAEPPVTFEGPHLKTTDRQEHISTDKDVKITQGGNVITGTGLDYTHSAKTVSVQGRARAVIPPSSK